MKFVDLLQFLLKSDGNDGHFTCARNARLSRFLIAGDAFGERRRTAP